MTVKIDITQAACFYFLKELQSYYAKVGNTLILAGSPYTAIKAALDEISLLGEFDPNAKNPSYLERYTQFQALMEKAAKHELAGKSPREAPSTLDGLFIQMYENKGQIKQNLAKLLGTSDFPKTTHEINQLIHKKTKVTSTLDPRHPDNRIKAFFSSMLGFRYHPLKKENVPYLNEEVTIEGTRNVRMGNQTQSANRVNPVFKRYLLANARRSDASQPFSFVYINLLKRDQIQIKREKRPRKIKDKIKRQIEIQNEKFVRKSEGARAKALEGLNSIDDLKVAVITLPADNSFLLDSFAMRDATEKSSATQHLHGIFAEVVLSIQQNANDFYMSEKVKKILFGNDFLTMSPHKVFEGKLGVLFKQAVQDITGTQVNSLQDLAAMQISPTQRNAILFHFVKYHLTSHVISTLKPKAFNTSCKDGIDRGAVHGLWFTLNSRFEQHLKDKANIPPLAPDKITNVLSEKEFITLLESPAMIVRNRGVNHNQNLIWNVLNERMQHDEKFASAHPYLNKWIKENNPHVSSPKEHTRKSFITSRKEDLKKGLDKIKSVTTLSSARQSKLPKR